MRKIEQDGRNNPKTAQESISYGPVPSRRFGRSLGINNIPQKVCSYSCTYCQVGRTIKRSIERQEFYQPDQLVSIVRDKVRATLKAGETIDFLTFVPDGEPTLDINLGHEIELLKPLGFKIAVITNASLLWRNDVREDLEKADLVSVKIDSVVEQVWRKIDRPHLGLQMDVVLQGLLEFAERYDGELVSESMLIRGANDDLESIEMLRDFLCKINPDVAYLAIPTRPPAEKFVQPPSARDVETAAQLLRTRLDSVTLLSGDEGDNFALTGNVADDLLAICAVHPMREKAVERLLSKAGADWSLIERLLSEGLLVEKQFRGKTFYRTALP